MLFHRICVSSLACRLLGRYCQQNIVLGTNFVDILYFSPALKVR